MEPLAVPSRITSAFYETDDQVDEDIYGFRIEGGSILD
ncbi:hypothetical protein VDG1235_1402 [Verrucomicrobiia bacterium DG1235]|nr:hypothetical protein VDG1235_1402 [Verrucomicrobiae bacterium DG1235]